MITASEINVVRTACPPLAQYSKAELAELAEEVGLYREDAVALRVLNDYSKLRDICRKIKKKK